MKKLNILKTIVDLFWILSIITIPIILLFIGFVLSNNNKDGIPIRIQGILYDEHNFNTKLLIITTTISFSVIVYIIFQFRKILKEFQKTTIFSDKVLEGFNNMGISLLIAAALSGISTFLIPLINSNKFQLEFSLSPFLLMLCFGLFFMVLSEVFKIAKQAKEENELTV